MNLVSTSISFDSFVLLKDSFIVILLVIFIALGICAYRLHKSYQHSKQYILLGDYHQQEQEHIVERQEPPVI
jgi:uncharacterized membrane protein